ncbi:MAG: tRNA (guanosine-2'-O-)-methyltransferase [Gammaproteobacteria bacterium]|jgi:tRNA (guanosine-2'-O-)-methyltransferase
MRPERFSRIVSTLQRRQPDLTIAMESLHKTRNLGAIARTCDAVGIGEIHAISSDPTNVTLGHKTAGGTEKWLLLQHHMTILGAYDEFRKMGFAILAAGLSDDAVDFRSVDYTQPTAIVVGSELDGLSNDASMQADQLIKVPLLGMVESLNVSVATGIILYEAARQREAAGQYESQRICDDDYHRLLFEWLHPSVAQYCRKNRRPYPNLDEHGEIIEGVSGNRRDGLKSIG